MKAIKQYEKGCIAVVEAFIDEYYTYDDGSKHDYFFVGDCIGDVLCIADEYWNMNQVVDVLKYKPTPDQLWGWYDNLTDPEVKTRYHLKSYLALIN